MVQAHGAVGEIAARKVGQVMVTHRDRDGEKPFVGISDERGVTRWVLRGNRRELVKRRRHCSRVAVADRTKRTLNDFRA